MSPVGVRTCGWVLQQSCPFVIIAPLCSSGKGQVAVGDCDSKQGVL